jgi:hypothetical protein
MVSKRAACFAAHHGDGAKDGCPAIKRGLPSGSNGSSAEASGNVIVVRYADDIVAGFEHEADARRFWDAMRTRFEQFGLELHGEKTRLAGVRSLRGGQA